MDDIPLPLQKSIATFVPQVCSKAVNGIADTEGFMALFPQEEGKVEMIFFNPDGSTGAMCGNGGRCCAAFAVEQGWISSTQNFIVSVFGVEYRAISHADGMFSLFFPPPQTFIPHLQLSALQEQGGITCSYIDVGSTHVVMSFPDVAALYGIAEDFRDFPLHTIAPYWRHHSALPAGGANVNIYHLINGEIHLRTYERGVEAETGACGTGAIATALAVATTKNHVRQQITIIPPSRIPLYVLFHDSVTTLNAIELRGPAITIGEVTVSL
jgi:diaminopimelate epimerase